MPPVLVLAGGLGTRLESQGLGVPKPLAPVAGRPFLHHLLDYVRDQGAREVVLCVGHLAGQIVESCGDGSSFGLSILYSREERPLGTGGALRNALPLVRGDPFFVLNGDTFMRINLSSLLAAQRRTAASITMAVASVDDRERFGAVSLDAEGRVVVFGGRASGRGTVNAGTYVIARDVCAGIAADTKVSLENDVLPGFVGRAFYGVLEPGAFIDIGTPESYAEAQSLLAGNR